MAGKKISELSALGAAFATTDLFEVSDAAGGGSYTSKSITGANLALGVYSVIGGWDSGNSRLGIGTASPVKDLHIFRDSGETTLRLSSGGTYHSDILQSGTNLFIQNTSVAGNIIFYDDAAERMRINTDGNVGIRTNAPKTALSTVYDYDTTTFENQLSDNEGGGEILRYGSGQAGAVGTLHFLQTDGSWDATDSDAVGTGGSQLLGIAMGTDPGTDGMLLKGYYRVAAASIEGTGVIGAPAYVSEVAGKIDFTAPSGSADFVRILGYCIDYHSDGDGSILIYFDPDKTWILLS